MVNNKKLEEATNRVYEKLSKFSPKEFAREVEKHEDGDIAKIPTEVVAPQNKGSFRVVESVNKKDKQAVSHNP